MLDKGQLSIDINLGQGTIESQTTDNRISNNGQSYLKQRRIKSQTTENQIK